MFIDINSISIDDDDAVVTTDSEIQNSRIDKAERGRKDSQRNRHDGGAWSQPPVFVA